MLRKSFLWDFFKRYDFSFIGICSAIFLIGLLNLYSATHASMKTYTEDLYKTQFMWFCISMLIAVTVSFVRPKNFFKIAYIFYIINVGFLVLTLVWGHSGMGAQRWIGIGSIKFQPSEPMKLALVLALSRWFFKSKPEGELGFRELLVPGIITMIPVGLVVVQPDLGTGILLLLIFLSMAVYRRLKWKTILTLAGIGVICASLMYVFALKEYQKKRIETFIDPTSDAKGAGYNSIQSKIAIGAGQFFGKGFKKSTQASLNYLPENHTDFVFSVYNEEHGFFGSMVLISLFLILFFRFLWLASATAKFFNSLLVIGMMSIFFWHTFVNMSMVMGLMPIVGVPLPLMSYGGSILLTIGFIIGMATSVSNARNFFN